MLPAAFIAMPLILGAVLATSGFGKLGDDDETTAQEWAGLGVADRVNVRGVRRSHPWAELALAAALIVVPGPLGIAAASVAVTLCTVYLVLVWRAVVRPEPTSCACFGEDSLAPITGRTVARNVVLLILAVLSLAHAVVVGSPLEALVAGDASTWWWLLAVAMAGLTGHLIAPMGQAPAGTAAGDAAELTSPQAGEEIGDYVRTLTPLANLVDAEGVAHSLVSMSALRAQLLLFVKPGCGSCPPVVAQVPDWQQQLPEVQLRIVVTEDREDLRTLQPEWVPYALHDPNGEASRMLRILRTPTAVLLGTDGMLAGGPVAGPREIERFMSDIKAELDAAHSAAG